MELTAEELYKFDCQGHFTVRSALSPTELAACRAAVAAASSATDLPLPAAVERYAAAVLQGVLTQDQRLDHNKAGAFPDTPLHIVSSGSTDVASDLGAQGDVLERDRLGYESHRMWSACRGMRVFIALSDTARLSAVAGSHNTAELPPPGALSLPGVLQPLPLQAGDMCVLAATTLYGLAAATGTPQLLSAVIAGAAATPPLGYEQQPTPAWLEALPPETRAIVGPSRGIFGYPREQTDRVAPTLPAGVSPASAAERWVWDTQGVLALPRVMDAEWVQAALSSLAALAGDDGSWKGIPHLARNTVRSTHLNSETCLTAKLCADHLSVPSSNSTP